MPEEPFEHDFVDIVGDFVPLVSGADIRPEDRSPLTPDESKRFNATFEHFARGVNRQYGLRIITRKHFDLAKFACEVVKKRFGDLPFTGDGTGGFGMRAIIPEDVYGDGGNSDDSDKVWELGNGSGQGNWVVGARASRYSRNDHGYSVRNTATFPGGSPAICRDANNDMWYVLYWGIIDEQATGLVHGYWVSLNNRDRAFKDVSLQMKNTELAYAELGYGVMYEPTVPFKSGVQIKPIDAASGSAVGQIIALRPVGVCFATQRRLLINNAAITTPSSA